MIKPRFRTISTTPICLMLTYLANVYRTSITGLTILLLIKAYIKNKSKKLPSAYYEPRNNSRVSWSKMYCPGHHPGEWRLVLWSSAPGGTRGSCCLPWVAEQERDEGWKGDLEDGKQHLVLQAGTAQTQGQRPPGEEDTFEKEAKDYRNGRRRPRVDSAHLPRASLPPSVSRMANTANMHPPVWNLLSDPAPPLQAIVLTYRTGMARPHCPSPHALLGSLSEPSELQT